MLGSAHIFTDQFIDKEENSKLQVGCAYVLACVLRARVCVPVYVYVSACWNRGG